MIADRQTYIASHGLPPDYYRREAREVAEAEAEAEASAGLAVH